MQEAHTTITLSRDKADLLASIISSLRKVEQRGAYPSADDARFRQNEALTILRDAGAVPTWERHSH